MEEKEVADSQTVRKELTLLSQVSIHFDKEEVKMLYFNMNCNYLKVNELLSNVPSDKIKEQIEAFETKAITRDQFLKLMNKLLEDKFAEDERIRKKVRIELKWSEWNLPRSNSPVLRRLHLSDLVHVFQFLDVYSVYNLSKTEKFMFKQEKAPAVYKYFAQIAFKQLPQVNQELYETLLNQIRRPDWGRLNDVQRATILSDVRTYVWGKDPKTIKTSKKYFKENQNFREIFFQFPRLRFDGYYSCCETYFRKGEADMTGFYVPIHYVKSYRNLRFFDNGQVLYLISTKQLKADTAARRLSMKALLEKQEKDDRHTTLYLGEFVLANGLISIKMPDRGWLNEMEHVLRIEETGDTSLQIESHVMRDLETGGKHAMEKDMGEKERRYYFERVASFGPEVHCSQQRSIYNFEDLVEHCMQ